MKKIIISISLFISLKRFSQTGIVYCRPEMKYCIHNLKEMKKWLVYDHQNNQIPDYVFQEYLLVLEHTRRSLEMMVENKGQCDTTDTDTTFKYDLKP